MVYYCSSGTIYTGIIYGITLCNWTLSAEFNFSNITFVYKMVMLQKSAYDMKYSCNMNCDLRFIYLLAN